MLAGQLELFDNDETVKNLSDKEFIADIEKFNEFGKETQCLPFPAADINLPVYINEFWTAKQRAAHSLHSWVGGPHL
jgi:hypothetical protein